MDFNFGIETGRGPGLLDFLGLATGQTANQRGQARVREFAEQHAQEFDEINKLDDPVEGAFRAGKLLLKAYSAGVPESAIKSAFAPLARTVLNNVKANRLRQFGDELRGEEEGVEFLPRETAAEPQLKGLTGLMDRFGGSPFETESRLPLGPGLEASETDLTLPFERRARPGRPGRKFEQADVFKVFGSDIAEKGFAGVDDLLKLPSGVNLQEQQGKAAMAERSERQVKTRVAELEEDEKIRRQRRRRELAEENIPGSKLTFEDIALDPSLHHTLPARERSKPPIVRDLGDRVEVMDPDTFEVLKTTKKGPAPRASGGVLQMTPSQLVGLRNSLLRQYQAAQKEFSEEGDARAADLADQINALDQEIEKRGKFEFKGSGRSARTPTTKSGERPTAGSVKKKFGLE